MSLFYATASFALATSGLALRYKNETSDDVLNAVVLNATSDDVLNATSAVVLNATSDEVLTATSEDELNETAENETAENVSNVCINERLAPQFFMIGVPKSGQARFYNDFITSPGIVSYRPGKSEPEWHAQEPWIFADGFDIEATDDWLVHYPECVQDRRMVAIDCTPGYFGDRKTPSALANVYRRNNLLDRIQFMVLLRDPVARMHSHYYHYIAEGVMADAKPECPSTIFPATFYVTVRNMLDRGTVCDCPCDNIVTDCKYADSFKRYFANIPSNQFHVVPFDNMVSERVVDYAWDMLDVPHGEHRTQLSRVEADIGPYPNLVTEVDEATMLQLEAFMDRVAGAQELAALFAGSHVNLFNYTQELDDGESIERWLKQSWGRSGL